MNNEQVISDETSTRTEQRNRVIEGMQEWWQGENTIGRLFPLSAIQSNYFQKLKLDYLHELYTTIRKDASGDERITLRILRGEMKELEKRIYPNLWVRVVMGTIRPLMAGRPPAIQSLVSNRTDGVMKKSHREMKVQQGASKENRTEQATNYKVQRPELLEKKRVSENKGLRM